MPDESAGEDGGEIDDVFDCGDIKMPAINDSTILVSRTGGAKLIIGGYIYTKYLTIKFTDNESFEEHAKNLKNCEIGYLRKKIL